MQNKENFTAETKSKALAMAVWKVAKQYGEEAISKGVQARQWVETIPTGLASLDAALGAGGLPKGRIVEIYGGPGVGKTALALHLARQVPAALYIDADYGITQTQGAGLYTFQADTLEDVLAACEIAAAGFDLIVVDTLSALPTRSEAETEPGDFNPGKSAAVVLSRSLPRLAHSLDQHGCTLILVTQTRLRPGVIYGNPEFSLGGRALKHWASVRLSVSCPEIIRRRGVSSGIQTSAIGQKIRVSAVKNKCGPQFREATMEIWYDNPAWDCLKEISVSEKERNIC